MNFKIVDDPMSKRTLVLGASLKTNRYSNFAIHKLVEKDHDVLAVGLKKGEVAGVEVKTELNKSEEIDTITLYLNPSRQKQYYNSIIALNPKRVIFNPGTENLEFYELLKEEKIQVEVACTLVLLSTDQY